MAVGSKGWGGVGVRVVGREEIKLINLKQNYLPDL